MEMGFLSRIGLTKGEIKVYDALLLSGPVTTGRIVKTSGISSSKVYPILDKLVGKGLVTYVMKGKVKHFQAASPSKLKDLITEQKQDIEKHEEEVNKFLPALLTRYNTSAPSHEAVVYEGYGGVKSYFEGLLKDAKKGDERLVFGARSGYPLSKPAQRFFRSYDRKRVRAGLGMKIIFSEEFRKSQTVKQYSESKLTQVKYLPQITLSSVGIQKDSVDILIWTKDTTVVFAIRSKEVAKTFRKYFEVLWKSAKK